ncbi:MAG TPA: hypothetical protein DD620_01255 [Verrucomicrobia bacterium]|nr:hypothetical protein [Verrucomicrobiota bacterium]
MMHSHKHRIEYAFLLLFGTTIRLLPLRIALLLGWLIAFIGHYLLRFRRAEARRRIRHVLGKKLTPAQINKIAWISWRNLCFNIVEAIRFKTLSRENLPVDNSAASFISNLRNQLKESPSGAIAATIHMGNWDLAGIIIDLHHIPIFSIARRQKNPLTDTYLNRARKSFNMEVLLNDNHVLKEIVCRLTQRQLFAILPDVRNPRPAHKIPFLNGTANLGAGAAFFARKCDCPIQPFITHRIGWSQHTFILLHPITPDPTAEKDIDQQRMMEELMTQFTSAIKTNPEQYFWYNKRWVLDPL